MIQYRTNKARIGGIILTERIAAWRAGYAGDGARIVELDGIRGICVCIMIFDHALYDFAYLFPQLPFHAFAHGWHSAVWPRGLIQPLVASGFIFLSGVSCAFSRSNLRRGTEILMIALGLTALTIGLDHLTGQTDQFAIRFGVLHLLASSMLLYGMYERILRTCRARRPDGTAPERRAGIRLPVLGLIAIGVGLWFLLHPAESAFPGQAILIQSSGAFRSVDYFPLLPWCGVFMLGAYTGPRLYPERVTKIPGKRIPGIFRPVLWMGRYALPVYLLHQPILYVLLYAATCRLIG